MINNPHDKYFRSAFSNKEIAIDFVKGFMPKEILGELDLDYFEQVTESFVDKQFQLSISDVIYQTRFRNSDQAVLISLLFEHKSYCDGDTIFQLHRYLPNIWEHHVKQGQDRPLVIPLVIYHGKEKWKKKGMADFFMLPNEYFRQFLPIFEYILVDVSQYSEKEILAMHLNAMVVNMMMALKYGRNSGYLLENLSKVVYRSMEYVNLQGGKNFLEITFVYLASINQFPNPKWEVMIQKLPKPIKSTAMTMYERLIKQGEEKGIQLAVKIIHLNAQNIPIKKIASQLDCSIEKVKKILAQI